MVLLTSHMLTSFQSDLEIVSLDWIFFFFWRRRSFLMVTAEDSLHFFSLCMDLQNIAHLSRVKPHLRPKVAHK